MSNSKTVVSSYPNCDADQLDLAEYEALETALLQTKRGRDFLGEYLRRNGQDAVSAQTIMMAEGLVEPHLSVQPGIDSNKILQAVEKLHHAVMAGQQQQGVDHVRMNVLEMANAIATTRAEITAMRTDGDNDHLSEATGEMDAIVRSTEKATNDILQAAEKIQEVAWRLREAGTDVSACEEIDNAATEIYMACSFQDLTGQRTTKVVQVLQYLEARIASMIEIWGITGDEGPVVVSNNASDSEMTDVRPDAHLLNGPQNIDAALGQDNIDALLRDEQMDFSSNSDHLNTSNDHTDEQIDNETLSLDIIDDNLKDTSSDDIIDEEQLKALFS